MNQRFLSPLSAELDGFLQFKRRLGYRYVLDGYPSTVPCPGNWICIWRRAEILPRRSPMTDSLSA